MLSTRAFCLLYRRPFRQAAKAILQGRLLDPEKPDAGRWLRCDVDTYLDDVWHRTERLLPSAELATLPNLGNRHNVFLAVVTVAAYQELLQRGTRPDYAKRLVADLGWKIYERLLRLTSLPVRLTTRTTRRRLERTLRALMVFPFSAPGAPGYEVKVRPVDDGIATYWTHCPPQSFVRRLVESRGDNGELDAFYNSWCQYDWPGADIIASDGAHGHYDRPHTLSRGDPVCDMCWHTARATGPHTARK